MLVVVSEIDAEPDTTPLVDLQCRLIQARDDEDAYAAALELGRSEEHSYANARGDIVTWRFVGLHDLRELDCADVTHGVEVFNEMVRDAPGRFLTPKAQLTCFWVEANKDRPVTDTLDDD